MKTMTLKSRLKERQLTIGSWITIGNPAIPEILSESGFDWLVVDIEHTTIDLTMVQQLISSIQANGMAALVRVSKNEEVVIKRVLDAGAEGIIIPMICSAEDAKKAVDYSKYPPEGKRGVGLARAQKYGMKFDEYISWVKDYLIIIAQIEHVEALKNLDSILNTEGIDGTIIGPYDLSGSLGAPGKYDNVDYSNALSRYIKISTEKKIAMGYHVIEPDFALVQDKIAEGYTFVAFSTDFFFLQRKSQEEMNKVIKFCN